MVDSSAGGQNEAYALAAGGIGEAIAGLNSAQMSVVREFVNSIFRRMESGNLDLGEGMVEVVTAISNFETGTHAEAMNYMWAAIVAGVG